jgi:energy-converting hydrogenase Eha subunit E
VETALGAVCFETVEVGTLYVGPTVRSDPCVRETVDGAVLVAVAVVADEYEDAVVVATLVTGASVVTDAYVGLTALVLRSIGGTVVELPLVGVVVAFWVYVRELALEDTAGPTVEEYDSVAVLVVDAA